MVEPQTNGEASSSSLKMDPTVVKQALASSSTSSRIAQLKTIDDGISQNGTYAPTCRIEKYLANLSITVF